jgi:hypothetical protein
MFIKIVLPKLSKLLERGQAFWRDISLSRKTGSVLRNQSTAFSFGYVSMICGEFHEFNKYYVHGINKYI